MPCLFGRYSHAQILLAGPFTRGFACSTERTKHANILISHDIPTNYLDMTTSRSESVSQPYGRKRSNTVQSYLRSPPTPATPLALGDAQILSLWVHDVSQGSDVLFNTECWPGVLKGDMIRVTAVPADGEELSLREQDGFLFIVQGDDMSVRNNMLQVSPTRSYDQKLQYANTCT